MTHPYVDRLGLRAHPEGGWFTETWRAGTEVDTARGRRASATGILYLLDEGERSLWHRVGSDELWLHHTGGPLVLRLGGADDRPGETVELLLGSNVLTGERPQALVPAGCWQSAQPATDAAVLLSCVVSPGFDYADFELLGE